MKVFNFNSLPMLNIAWKIGGIDKCKPSAWLISSSDKEPIGVIVRKGVLYGSLPSILGEGTYGLKAAWLDKGKRYQTEIKDLFAVSANKDEVTEECDELDEITLECDSQTQTATANDGLSAYELSVLRGKTTLSEDKWLDELAGVNDESGRAVAEKGRVDAEKVRTESETLRENEWRYRKALIDGAVQTVNSKLTAIEAIQKDVTEKMDKLERLIAMYRAMVAGVDELRMKAQNAMDSVNMTSVGINTKVTEAVENVRKEVRAELHDAEKNMFSEIKKDMVDWLTKSLGN